MTVISGLGPAAAVRPPPRAAPYAAFMVPEDGAHAEAAQAAACIAGPTLLALQEAERDTVRDRQARRHGHAMLDMLARLQRALLAPAGSGADALESLAALLRATPPADDPQLAAVQRAVLVRAAVEMARRRRETTP